LVALSVQCFANVKITTPTVPNGTVNTAYSAAIQASGGCTPYKWTIVSGVLPTGITAKASVNSTAFNLTETPTKTVTDSFSVKATNCHGTASQISYKIVIQSSTNHIVNLNWNGSTTGDVVGYNVYRSPDAANWTKINLSLIGPTLYTDSTVSNSSTYYYSATAVDVNGKESVKTPPVKAVIP
jgi:fibronectin type 3 domain-containing protein